jgi:hypothetical protein
VSRREQAIESALRELFLHPIPPGDGNYRAVLSDLIDQAEAGKLKEPLSMSYVGSFGIQTVYPDGRIETA